MSLMDTSEQFAKALSGPSRSAVPGIGRGRAKSLRVKWKPPHLGTHVYKSHSNRPYGTTADPIDRRPSSRCAWLWRGRSWKPTPMGGAGSPAPEIGEAGGRGGGALKGIGPPVFPMCSRAAEVVRPQGFDVDAGGETRTIARTGLL